MNWFRLTTCIKCQGDPAADNGDWICIQCGTYYYTGLYQLHPHIADKPPVPDPIPLEHPEKRFLGVETPAVSAVPEHRGGDYGGGGDILTAYDSGTVLLALDVGVRETDWAVFQNDDVAASGIAGLRTRRKLEPEVRVSNLIESLDELATQWSPKAVALCQPSGINWPVPDLDLLVSSLGRWAEERGLLQFSYTAQEVRTANAGHPNASRDQRSYAIMLLLGPIGQGRSGHEWAAIAVDHYHLTRSPEPKTHGKSLLPRTEES